MCRITLTTEGMAVAERISHLQRNGGTLPAEFCVRGGCAVGLNRFTVTSGSSVHGVFPLESERYVLAFNGEVYGFRQHAFVDQGQFTNTEFADPRFTHPQFTSDGHFAMSFLLDYGIETFFKEADLQGTFLVYDKLEEQWWCVVDQMNIAGCFFAHWGDKLIIASESAPIHLALNELGVDQRVPIEVLLPGRALCRKKSGEISQTILRPQSLELYRAKSKDDSTFERFMGAFSSSLVESVRRRIPPIGPAQTSPVGVLCSGGIDSSVILAITVKLLREANQLERLKIFTLGGESPETADKNLDEYHVRLLLKSLDLDPEKFLHVVSHHSLEPIKAALFQKYVFAELPRLITPNPILRSQVRNCVMMSSLLFQIKKAHPDIISLLTGDAADELMAGYAEMLRAKESASAVCEEIIVRVANFPMTDGARVSLASFFGASAAKWLENPVADSAPVEIRMPFTSHHFMEALSLANLDFLFGQIDGVRCNKFPLRLLGASLGIPREIIIREKMQFNEGGTGDKNGEPLELEKAAALNWMKSRGLDWQSPEIFEVGKLYNFSKQQPTDSSDLVPGYTDQLALVLAARASGANRLFLGKIFQAQPTAPPIECDSYFPQECRSVLLALL